MLDRFDAAVPALLAALLFAAGEWLERSHPRSAPSGWQLLVWGFCISTVVLYHATFTINSLAHRFGTRRYATRDDSRNNCWLALLTFGEGWHNNHHHYPGAPRARASTGGSSTSPTTRCARSRRSGIVWDLRACRRDARSAPSRGARA